MSSITRTNSIDEVILHSLQNYIKGRADEIVAKHTNEAIAEIDNAVRDEISKTVLTIGRMVHLTRSNDEIIITISDKRENHD